ncbi:MAG: MoaD/ThiS family protein [Methanobacteriota archaeon]|nr:MAG: MoaD/ThiS family protein [Euryarchaeota archaeon]
MLQADGSRDVQETRGMGDASGGSIEVYVPYPLRGLTNGIGTVEIRAADLGQAIAELNRRFPGLAYRILDDQGRLRRFVNAFVNDEPVSHLSPNDVPLRTGDVVTILPSVAGG